ncbi:MAG: glucokinase [Planctomycetaceae bacterium]|nr:glucokinase [Planctomycetaceae bacterium]
MLLAGDIGGTKTVVAVFEPESPQKPLHEQTFVSRDYSGLTEIVTQYLGEHDFSIDAACFGVAGPVSQGQCETIDLPWKVDEAELGKLTGSSKVRVINDLEAMAWSLENLSKDDLHCIDQGHDIAGNRGVIAAGTGLGEAGVWYGQWYHPFASEGGHADFSPQSHEEDALLSFLRNKFEHVSWERVLSGPGIENIYEFLVNTYRESPTLETVKRMMQEDNAAVITSAALSKTCMACVKTMEIFVGLYGAEAGNLALKLMATGGIYIGGGIAPQILSLLDSDIFRDAFTHKGRLSSVIDNVPVYVIKTNKAPLLGAAHVAHLLATDQPIY